MNIQDLVTFEVNGKKCVALVRKLTEREEYRSGLVVHHINGDKKDNRRCNLRFMSRRAHARPPSKRQQRNKFGRFV